MGGPLRVGRIGADDGLGRIPRQIGVAAAFREFYERGAQLFEQIGHGVEGIGFQLLGENGFELFPVLLDQGDVFGGNHDQATSAVDTGNPDRLPQHTVAFRLGEFGEGGGILIEFFDFCFAAGDDLRQVLIFAQSGSRQGDTDGQRQADELLGGESFPPEGPLQGARTWKIADQPVDGRALLLEALLLLPHEFVDRQRARMTPFRRWGEDGRQGRELFLRQRFDDTQKRGQFRFGHLFVDPLHFAEL